MADSDSEDDFMSDKFLQPQASSSSKPATYSDRRNQQALAAHKRRPVQLSAKEAERQRRKEGLETSLFERARERQPEASSAANGGEAKPPVAAGGSGLGKAMGMMMKMGWKPGQAMGQSSSSSAGEAIAEGVEALEEEADHEQGQRGLGMKRKRSSDGSATPDPSRSESPALGLGAKQTTHEPIRLSMWAGRSGLGARPRSPSPAGPDGEQALSSQKAAQLASSAEAFRNAKSTERLRAKTEGQLYAARRVLVELDAKTGVAFHPLHVVPANLKETLPYPLMSRMFPELAEEVDEEGSALPRSEADLKPIVGKSLSDNKTQAEKIKDMMKRDMLGDIEEEERLSNGIHAAKRAKIEQEKTAAEEKETTIPAEFWDAQVDGVKRVLRMTPEEQLSFLISQLRENHYYCFWCAAQYGSADEMDGKVDGVTGCPGEDEDDH